jgi:hypothetical protein
MLCYDYNSEFAIPQFAGRVSFGLFQSFLPWQGLGCIHRIAEIN